MTEPMATRDAALRILSDLYGDRTLSEMPSVEREAKLGLMQAAIEADRAAQTAALIAGRDVKGLSVELWCVSHPGCGPELYAANTSPGDRIGFARKAAHVLRLVAAAEDKAMRDAIEAAAQFCDRNVDDGANVAQAIRTLTPDHVRKGRG